MASPSSRSLISPCTPSPLSVPPAKSKECTASDDPGAAGVVVVTMISARGLLTPIGAVLSITVLSSCCCCSGLSLDDSLSLLLELPLLMPGFDFAALSTGIEIPVGSAQIATPPFTMAHGFVGLYSLARFSRSSEDDLCLFAII